MVKLFNTNRIAQNDPLRDIKINALESIKDTSFKMLRKNDTIREQLRDEIIEKYFPNIIKRYKEESWGKSDLTILPQYKNFENDWFEKLISATSESEVKKIKKNIRMIMEEGWDNKVGSELGDALIKVDNYAWSELRSLGPIENSYTDSDKSKCKWLEILKRNPVKFDKIFEGKREFHGADWSLTTARNMWRDELVARIADWEADIEQGKVGSESWKKNQEEINKRKKDYILNDLQKCEFCWNSYNSRVMVKKRSYEAYPTLVSSFQRDIKERIEELNDNYLPTGQQKNDLLSKLEEVIKNGVREVNAKNGIQSNSATNTTDDSASEISVDTSATSIFGDSDEAFEEEITTAKYNGDNGSAKDSANHNKETTSEAGNIEQLRNEFIQNITNLLNQEPIVVESDLKAKNQNWLAQMKAANTLREMAGIKLKVKLNISEIRRTKKHAANLDDLLQKYQNNRVNANELIDDIKKANKSSGNDVNKEKEREVKKAMIQNDPELYFDTFAKWIEEEEEKIEEERKKSAEAETSSEIEYDEEERKFLKGEITDQQKKEQIAERIEVKINVKKKSWSLWKWLKEQTKWLKTKARLLRKSNKVGFDQKKAKIEQEIENAKNSSNLYENKAYQNNQSQVQELLRELEIISSENNPNTTADNKFPTSWVIGIGATLLITTLIAGLIIRQQKKKKTAR